MFHAKAYRNWPNCEYGLITALYWPSINYCYSALSRPRVDQQLFWIEIENPHRGLPFYGCEKYNQQYIGTLKWSNKEQ